MSKKGKIKEISLSDTFSKDKEIDELKAKLEEEKKNKEKDIIDKNFKKFNELKKNFNNQVNVNPQDLDQIVNTIITQTAKNKFYLAQILNFIKENEFYKQLNYNSFSKYLESKHKFSRALAYKLIDAYKFYTNDLHLTDENKFYELGTSKLAKLEKLKSNIDINKYCNFNTLKETSIKEIEKLTPIKKPIDNNSKLDKIIRENFFDLNSNSEMQIDTENFKIIIRKKCE